MGSAAVCSYVANSRFSLTVIPDMRSKWRMAMGYVSSESFDPTGVPTLLVGASGMPGE